MTLPHFDRVVCGCEPLSQVCGVNERRIMDKSVMSKMGQGT